MNAIDENVSGLERQKQLARTFTASTVRLLGDLGDLTGASVLDLGCGIGETTRLLAARVGATGSVVGVDFNPALVESAASMTTEPNVSFAQGDVHDLSYEDATFDVVFARLLLLHVADPQAALQEMLRVCRPQGTVIVNDGDFETIYTSPDRAGGEGLVKLFSIFNNPRIGTNLWHMFRDCGYEHVEYRVDRMLVRDADSKRLATMTVEAMREAAVQSELMTEQEVDTLRDAMAAGVEDDSYMIGFPEMYAAWVQR